MEEIRRGWHSEDVLEFTGPAYQKLNEAAVELCWLLDRGYPEKPASVFVSNHHLLSERQRIALVRMPKTVLSAGAAGSSISQTAIGRPGSS